MQCPNCHHVSSATRLKCSSCGQAYDRATLENLHHLQYTLAWLDERATLLGPKAHQQLRDEAQSQLDALRDALGLTPPRTPEEIARELALVQSARQATKHWARAFALTAGAARALWRYLSQQIEELEAQLAGRPAPTRPIEGLDALDFALQSLPSWVENVPLRSASADILRQHLEKERETLLQSLAPPPHRPSVPVGEPAPQPAPSAHSADPRFPALKPNWARLLRWLLYVGIFIVVVGAALQGNATAAVVGLGFAALLGLLAIWSRRRARPL